MTGKSHQVQSLLHTYVSGPNSGSFVLQMPQKAAKLMDGISSSFCRSSHIYLQPKPIPLLNAQCAYATPTFVTKVLCLVHYQKDSYSEHDTLHIT